MDDRTFYSDKNELCLLSDVGLFGIWAISMLLSANNNNLHNDDDDDDDYE